MAACRSVRSDPRYQVFFSRLRSPIDGRAALITATVLRQAAAGRRICWISVLLQQSLPKAIPSKYGRQSCPSEVNIQLILMIAQSETLLLRPTINGSPVVLRECWDSRVML